MYKRYTNFAQEVMEQSLSGNIEFENNAHCKIDRKGDLITKIYLKITVSGTSNSNGKWAFSSKLGNSILDSVTLIINGTEIDKQYGEWFNVWDNFLEILSMIEDII